MFVCGSASATRPAKAEPPPLIKLTRLVLEQNGRPIGRLHPNGRTEGTAPDASGKPGRWVPGPRLHADGRITLTKPGLAARLKPSGVIVMIDLKTKRERRFGRIVGNKLLYGKKPGQWAARVVGNKLHFNRIRTPNTIIGKLDDDVRHTVLVMTAAFYINMSITRR